MSLIKWLSEHVLVSVKLVKKKLRYYIGLKFKW